MVFRGKNIFIALRVVLLFLSLSITNYVIFQTHYRISAAILCCLVIAQFIELLRFITAERKHFSRFFSALLHNDFTYHIPEKRLPKNNESWQHLANELLQKVQNLQFEKEEKHLLLQLITENAGTGILVFDESGEIFQMNNEVKKLLGATHIHNIDGLNKYAENLSQKFKALQAGEKTIIRLIKEHTYLQIIVAAQKFKQQEKTYTLLTLQHIGAELEEKEIQAWQKLTSVLSHEIMNALTPVISLAASANFMLNEVLKNENTDQKQEELTDIKNALNTIEKRSNSMLNFVQAYRKINKIPVPEFQRFPLTELVENAVMALDNKLKESKIEIQNNINPEIAKHIIIADPDLMQQVLLNLFINSIHALKNTENPAIEINAAEEGGGIITLFISDNGSGIPDENRDKIFIPFYSTKQEGSGIGLSVCKQIMQAHGGDIYLVPKMLSANKTTFALSVTSNQ